MIHDMRKIIHGIDENDETSKIAEVTGNEAK